MLKTRLVGDGIRILSLNRPEAKNAFSLGLVQELRQAIEAIHTGQEPTRVLILNSAVPGVFCAGADLKERRTFSLFQTRSFLKQLRGTLTDISNLSIPTIAAVDGVALGGGFELALACDFRTLGKNAVVGLPEVRIGIIPGAGGTYRLKELVGASRAKELVLTAKRLSADEAQAYGLASAVSGGEATDAAVSMAEEICRAAPLSAIAAKRAIDGGVWEDEMYEKVVHSEDRMEGLRAFAEKRKPRFHGR